VLVSDAMGTGLKLLPDLAALHWARRQALLQLKDAAWEEKHQWEVVISVVEQGIRKQERKITKSLDVVKFKTKGEKS